MDDMIDLAHWKSHRIAYLFMGSFGLRVRRVTWRFAPAWRYEKQRKGWTRWLSTGNGCWVITFARLSA